MTIERGIEVNIQPDIPRDKRGRIRWKVLGQNPEKTQTFLEQLAHLFMKTVEAKPSGLENPFGISRATFGHMVARYYPKGSYGLRVKLSELKKTIDDLPRSRDGRIYWKALADQPEKLATAVQIMARQHLEEYGNLTLKSADKHNTGFFKAVQHYYPGRLRQLKRDLGLVMPDPNFGPISSEANQPVVYRDEQGHILWSRIDDPDQLAAVIEAEAQKAIEAGVRLVAPALRKQGYSGLDFAIYKFYPGGLAALRNKLDHPKVITRLWTGKEGQERIRQEAQSIYQEHGRLTTPLLIEIGRIDLIGAIVTHYPDQMSGLQKNLGITTRKRNYWNKETILTEAAAFYQHHGRIDYNYLIAEGRSDLNAAIRKYPGKITQLRADLGLGNSKESDISVEEANQQLRRLLE